MIRTLSVRAPRGTSLTLDDVQALIDDAKARGASGREPLHVEPRVFRSQAARAWCDVAPAATVTEPAEPATNTRTEHTNGTEHTETREEKVTRVSRELARMVAETAGT